VLGESAPLCKISSIRSFRGGTGKSNTPANLVALVVMAGQRVGVVEADIASAGIHVF
jgi:MinD-like ATPase involved in chromosome partitioning or flagellar assembly